MNNLNKYLKLCLSTVIVSSFIAISDNVANAQEGYENKSLEENLEKRKEYGFDNSTEKVKVLMQKSKYSTEFGTYLDNDEEKNLKNRVVRQDTEKKQIKEYILKNRNLEKDFADMYFDQAHGGKLVVLLKEKTKEKHSKTITNFKKKNKEANVDFKEIKYSEEELSLMVSNINKNREQLLNKKIDVVYTLPDLINQKIEIGIKNANITESYAINSLSAIMKIDKSLIKVVFKDSNNTPLARDTYTRPLKGGLTLTDNKYACTLGFSAIKDGKPYVVTAGHCFNEGDGVFQGGQYIGHTSFKHIGNSADAEAIYVTNSSWLSSGLYDSPFSITRVEVAGNDVIGDFSCKSGITTGLTCGVLQAKFYSGYMDYGGSTGKVWLDNIRLNDMDSNHGDSGAPVVSNTVETLKGIVLGGVDVVNGVPKYTAYSHITHVSNRLGVTPVTWK